MIKKSIIMNESLLLHNVSKKELQTLISETVTSILQKKESKEKAPQQEYISRNETAKILGVSLVTLNNWTKQKLLTAYRIKSIVRYKKAEVYQCLEKRK